MKRPRIRRYVAVTCTLLGMCALFLAAPTRADAPQRASGESVTVAIPQWREELLSMTILLAEKKGFFKDAGLNVHVVAVNNPYSQHKQRHADSEVLYMVSRPSATCQFASSTMDALLIDGPEPSLVQPLAFYLYGSTYDTDLVVSKRSGIKSVRDLKGKTIRLGQPATFIALKNILREGGLTLNDVEIVRALNSYNVLSELRAGKLDAAITYLPTMPLMLASGEVNVLKRNIFNNYVMPFVPHSMVVVNRQFGAAHPKTVAAFMRALHRADALARQNPQELIFTMYDNRALLGIPSYKLNKVWAEKSRDLFGDFHLTTLSDKLYVKGASVSVLSMMERFQDLLLKNRYIGHKVNLSDWAQYNRAQVTSNL